MSDQSISQIIANHLHSGKVEGYSHPAQAIVAWGTHPRFVGHDDPYIKGLGSLKLQVHATQFKGWVRIEAKPNVPTYDLFFENHDGRTGNLVARASILGVKPEHITQVIDTQLEGPAKDSEK